MLASVRYQKGRGNSVVYARARNASGKYYNFRTFAWDTTETSSARVFLTEFVDGDPLDSLYSADVAFPDVSSVQEVVDSLEELVVGSGAYEPPLTLEKIEGSTFLLKSDDTRLDNLDAPISLTSTYDQVDSLFLPMIDALTDLTLGINTANAGINNIQDALMGNWQILNKQMIFFRQDGSELMRFDLTDKLGNPSEHNVFKREKV